MTSETAVMASLLSESVSLQWEEAFATFGASFFFVFKATAYLAVAIVVAVTIAILDTLAADALFVLFVYGAIGLLRVVEFVFVPLLVRFIL